MAGAGGKGRVQHARDLRLLGEPFGHLAGARVMLGEAHGKGAKPARGKPCVIGGDALAKAVGHRLQPVPMFGSGGDRSEEHTSELPSLMRIPYAVFCLKKKKKLH